MVWLFALRQHVGSIYVPGDKTASPATYVTKWQKRLCMSYILHACSLCTATGLSARYWWSLFTCFSPPKQAGGDDQRARCCHDGCKARAGVHGGPREDTQSKWVNKSMYQEPVSFELFDCYFTSCLLLLLSSQRQHKQQSGAVVVLRGSGSRGNDSWTDLLPEEIFWSTASGVVRLHDPSVSSTVFSNTKTVIYTLEMRLAVLSKAYIWLDLRCFVLLLPVWFPSEKYN